MTSTPRRRHRTRSRRPRTRARSSIDRACSLARAFAHSAEGLAKPKREYQLHRRESGRKFKKTLENGRSPAKAGGLAPLCVIVLASVPMAPLMHYIASLVHKIKRLHLHANGEGLEWRLQLIHAGLCAGPLVKIDCHYCYIRSSLLCCVRCVMCTLFSGLVGFVITKGIKIVLTPRIILSYQIIYQVRIYAFCSILSPPIMSLHWLPC